MFKLAFSMGRKQLSAKGITTYEVNNDGPIFENQYSLWTDYPSGVLQISVWALIFFLKVYRIYFYIVTENTRWLLSNTISDKIQGM